jgi:hypothetical protein
MITKSRRLNVLFRMTDILLFVWRVGMVIFAVTAAVYGYLTIVAAEIVKCAGQPWLAGYSAGGVFKLSLLPLTIVGAITWVLIRFRNARIPELFSAALYRRTLLEVGRVRITVGMLLLFAGTLGCPIILASSMELLVRRYHAIENYCRADTTSRGLRMYLVDERISAAAFLPASPQTHTINGMDLRSINAVRRTSLA